MSVVGARPQFVKLAPMEHAFLDAGVHHVTLHTGQHYDYSMSDGFFETLNIREPAWNLDVGSGRHGRQTGAMLGGIEDVLIEERPDCVVVYGDTNSTLAAAVAAVKLHLPLVHLEAGLRSFNRAMPEEHNRVLTDHAADLLLAPTEVAACHLADEGLADRTVVVGDVMVDVLLRVARRTVDLRLPWLNNLGAESFVLATIHRAENTDDEERLRSILRALAEINMPVVFPVHPRVLAVAESLDLDLAAGALFPIPPLGYEHMVAAVRLAHAIITDSGGLQKEAFVLGTPTTTVRGETEWVETLEGGWNVLSPDPQQIGATVSRSFPEADRGAPYGAGDAAAAAVREIVGRYG